MAKCLFWDSTVFATILGGLIAGAVGLILWMIQEVWKDHQKNQHNKEEDRREILSVKDYLDKLSDDLKESLNDSLPSHVILPFLKQVKFANYNDEKLKKIRGLYNRLSLDIHVMENFLIRNQTAIPDNDNIFRENILKRHKEMREDILKKMAEIQLLISKFI